MDERSAYKSLSLEALRDAHKRIDRELYPDKATMIEQEIQKRLADGPTQPLPEKRMLSSRMTMYYKYIYPVLGAIVSFLFIIVFTSTPPNTSAPFPLYHWALCVLLLVIIISILIPITRAKVVEIDKQFIYISDAFKSTRVPLSKISKVSSNRSLNPEVIRIYFETPTTYGHKIVFIPKFRFRIAFSIHPIVNELQAIIRKHKEGN